MDEDAVDAADFMRLRTLMIGGFHQAVASDEDRLVKVWKAKLMPMTRKLNHDFS